MAFGALHAIEYSEQSGGRTDELATDLAATQLEPLTTGLAWQFDEWASDWKVHSPIEDGPPKTSRAWKYASPA
jgi:hypothetical protein